MVVQSVCIIGSGGNLLDILDTIEAINRVRHSWSVIGLLDDAREVGSEHLGYRILGPLAKAQSLDDCLFVSSIWNERSFRTVHRLLASCGVAPDRFATLVHPAASVSSRAKVGRGVLIHQGASIGGNVVIDDHVSIGPGCILGHGTAVRSYTCIAAGAVLSGGVECGANCYVGSASCVRQNLKIGDRALVGLGAVVVKDVEAESVVVGNPAAPQDVTSR